MGTILMVGISHDTVGRTNANVGNLMSAVCSARFREKVVPRISNDSVVYGEGDYQSKLHFPGGKLYDESYAHFGGAFGNLKPALGFKDSRVLSNCLERYQRVSVSWRNHFLRSGKYTYVSPPSFKEVERQCLIRPDNELIQVVVPPSEEEMLLAKQMYTFMNRVDNEYIDALERSARVRPFAVAVMGLAHAISMSRKSGHELISLCENEIQPIDLFRGYVATYALPRILLNK